MTDIEVDNQKLDLTLRLFTETPGGSISKDILFMPRTVPEDYEEVIFHLTREGYLRESKYSFTITHKGRAFINKGGFTEQYRRERRDRYMRISSFVISIIACIAAIISCIFTFLK